MIDNPSETITIEDVVNTLSVSSKKMIYIYNLQRKLHTINKDD